MSSSVQVALLGPVEVRVDGEPVALSSAPQRILIARLALAPGQVVAVPELIDALWVMNPPANANGNLQSYVSRLRRVIGPDRIAREPGGYRLHLERDDVDIGRAQRLVAEAHATADRAAAARLLDDALGLWRGEPLADLPDRLPFAAQLAWLSEWRLQIMEERFASLLDAGTADRALPDLERAATVEPNRERLHLMLMRALHQVGRTADALAAGQAYRRRLAEETGLDPGPALAVLERRLLADDPDLRPAAPATVDRDRAARRHAPPDRFVGRRVELERLRSALDAHHVVCMVGPGGVGKTRLVLELLDRHAHDRPPAFLIELGDVSPAADVPAVVATALGVRAAPAGALTAIVDRLTGEAALLVLDGSEHVLDAAADLVTEVLARCPAVRVLVTSRRRLGVAGEWVVRLGPLAEADQVTLFCDRASRLRGEFDPSDAARTVVAEICRLVDGLPLGVELAARREAVFGLAELRTRLARGLDVLEPAGDGDRSAGIAAAAEWSYRLLDPDTRLLFDRLTVCQGGFSLDALDHLSPPGVGNVEARLADLVEASMVVADVSADPPRYRLLETMRQIGAVHLAPEQLDEAAGAHTRWMLAQAERLDALQRARSPEATLLLRREQSNIRGALTRLIDAARWADAGRLAVPVAVAVSEDPHLDLLNQLRRLEAAGTTPGANGALCAIAAGVAAWLQGDVHVARAKLTAGEAALPADHPQRWVARLYRLVNHMGVGDVAAVEADAADLLDDTSAPSWAVANGVCGAALINAFTGDRDRGETWMTDHKDLLAEVGRVDGFVAYTRGELLAPEDPIAALSWFDRAYRQCDASGHTYNREVAVIGRTAVLIRLGRHAQAVPACGDLILRLRDMGMWPQVWTVVRLTAELLVALGEHRAAGALLAAADHDPLAPEVLSNDRGRQAALWRRIADRLARDQLTAVRAEGAAAGRSGAVALALAALADHP